MLNEWIFRRFDSFTVTPQKALKKNNYLHIVNELICLDTETSHNHNLDNPVGWVYQWAFTFQGQIIYGRNPLQFIQALQYIKTELLLDDIRKIVIYVHNLSYDAQYLKNFLLSAFGTDIKIIALKSHAFLTIEIDSFVFKCSYLLTNKSLAKFCKDMNVKHKKLVGEIDYDIIRNQNSLLYKKDWKYLFYDVVGLYESIQKILELEHDTLATIPLTSTGYVRRDCRNSAKKDKKARKQFLQTALDVEVYTMLKSAFAGGLSHGNRFYSGKTVKGNIKHFDFVSHYPTQQIVKDNFPIGKFNLLGENLSFSDIRPYVKDSFLIMSITFEDIELKDKKITMPYLQELKVKECMSKGSHIISDNGRVLKMTGITEINVTMLDLKLILSQYKYKRYIINKCFISQSGHLPTWLTNIVNLYFKMKSDLKAEKNQYRTQQVGEVMENLQKIIEDIETSYEKSKNRLNGIYGMTATDIVRLVVTMDLMSGEWTEERPNVTQELLEKYYKSRNNFLPYQFGVATTANARHELLTIIRDIIGYENFLYCDTDSCFFVDNENNSIEKRLEELNAKWKAENMEKHFYIESHCKKVHYHQFENEKENITQFRFLHSKCYAYVTDDKELHCTIAGVSAKAKDGTTREKELGCIDNLKDGFTFTKCGGTRAIYTEDDISTDENGNIYASACIITPTEKTLSNDIEKILEVYDNPI